jgi:hypothetical protein
VGAQAARRQGALRLSAKQENHFQIFEENIEMVDATGAVLCRCFRGFEAGHFQCFFDDFQRGHAIAI